MNQKMVDYYMDIVKRTSQLSYAERLKVGAILVKNDSIIAHSWNGTPRGWDNICEDKVYLLNRFEENRAKDSKLVILEDNIGKYYIKTKSCVTHAEEALIMKIASSTQSSEGATLFCTHSACMNCAKLIYGAKIKRFYYETEYRSSEGIDFLEQCGIEVIKYESPKQI